MAFYSNARNVLCLMLAAALMIELGDAISCTQVTIELAPCAGYLQGGGASSACCANVQQLYMQTLNDREAKVEACNCIKGVLNSFPSVTDAQIGGLASACGVQLSFTPSRNIDCNSLQ
ncbi:hypothetical protein KP509_13G061000 [Ceratopteris richardii]|uniref:Non-specific lipid-transfer protein n=1 Tax=Ceratopteris richardii TaxID=49495 RepID=A0A8T2TE00_CERRI|nr:hypothetical protein KP509_13G061000 [Ceratopteris richardii]